MRHSTSIKGSVRLSIRRSRLNEKSLKMFEINRNLISFIINDTHFIHNIYTATVRSDRAGDRLDRSGYRSEDRSDRAQDRSA